MKKSATILLGVLAATALLGAGCQGRPAVGTNSSDSSGNKEENRTGNDAYKQAESLQLPKTGNAAATAVQKVLERVFGQVKITGFVSNIPTQNDVTVEFTAARKITGSDVNAIVDSFKKYNFTVELNAVSGGTGVVGAKNSQNYDYLTMEIGDQKISVLIAPVGEYNSDSGTN
ncbi:MAG: hypothetical protein HY983_03165 [Candidatus Magasanikbacteria bacterium]|nr:hypothetical protein [Candidatus Magasanikbacteria bacterium]